MWLSGSAALFVSSVFYALGLRSCPENCQKADKSTLITCNTDTGACSQGCIPGYYGETCNRPCDVNCLGRTCQQRLGTCRCSRGYTFNIISCERNKGVKCKWNENCLNNACTSESRDECSIGCKPGWFGGSCQQNCSEHCVCHQATGMCASCEAGWYGDNCKSPCSSGCAGSSTGCERDGTCSQGCNSGYYGDRCQLSCPRECRDNLCTRNGTCVACVSGFYGKLCLQTCEGCVDGVCDMYTAECTKGCRRGYHGDECKLICPDECKDGLCTSYGSCVACKVGFYGELCDEKCEGCSEGACNETTGACAKGCVSGFYGTSCTLRCKGCEGHCNMDNGYCEHEGNQWNEVQSWVGGGAAVVIISIIAAVLVYIYRRLKRMNGVMYDVVKWRRRAPSGDDSTQVCRADASGYTHVDDVTGTIPPRVWPVSPARPSSYIEPRHSGSTVPTQQEMLTALMSDQQENEPQAAGGPTSDRLLQEVSRHSDEWSDRPGSYVLPSYCEVDEELMVTLPTPSQGTEGLAPLSNTTSCHVVADVRATEEEICIPLIAECFGLNETEDSSPGDDTKPYVENYDHLFRYDNPQDDEVRIIQPRVCQLSRARSVSKIESRTGPTQQHLLSARVFDQKDVQPQEPAASPSDRLLQEVPITTLGQPAQGAEMAAAVVKKSSLADVAVVQATERDITIPLIAECFGSTETEDSSPDEDSNELVENYDNLFRDHYMQH